MTRRPKHHVIIVGGGIAGLLLATRLGRAELADVTLVDKAPSHVWKPMLHTFAAGTANAQQRRIPFVTHGAQTGFRFLPGALGEIDTDAQSVTVQPLLNPAGQVLLSERQHHYDTLVLAAGSKANDFDTPGVARHCLFIDDLTQAETFNQRLYEELLRMLDQGRPLRVAIVGGGATGVELAAEIARLLEVARSYGIGDLRPQLDLMLLESGPRILAAFPEEVAQAATRQLRRIGVEVRENVRVAEADADGFALEDGSRIDATLRVWAAGVKASEAVQTGNMFEHSPTGQIIVRPTLQTTVRDDVFALGDCASLTPAGAERPLPPTAQVARQQALHLARQFPAFLDGRPPEPFQFQDQGKLVSLGHYNTFGTLGRDGLFKGGFIEGRLAQLGHALLYRLHQMELHGPWRAASLWLSDAFAAPVRPRIRVEQEADTIMPSRH
ncbi:NAD(P)/FAD-dependent oxidoreductase [Niveispirillum fermenti]|uniref:NAD(P)/FAD-dependent oxidoreductase n=1 Tax=Niveispirillum fermenti TaxID=1233113 RepID=UPI003A8C749E